jgi:CRISP-associated protein Cas1
MLKGRLGLSTARVPQADRHGVMWLERGKLYVDNGNLTFVTAGGAGLPAGVYQLPFQNVTNILLGPGTTISHDALRILARNGTGVIAVGEDGVRFYASMPFGADSSELARKQVTLWANPDRRVAVARRMYALRMGEVVPHADLNALRGIEGHRMKEIYKQCALKYGIEWTGRRYDRNNPANDDDINTAINHASVAVRSAAMIAVAITTTIPQLGFIHEASGDAFCLDIADIFRASVLLPAAFEAVKIYQEGREQDLERVTRQHIGRKLRKDKVIPEMIDKIKKVLDVDDHRSDT